MSYIKRFKKHPADTIDYDFLFGSWLDARADTIQSFTVTCDTGLSIGSTTLSGTTIRAFFSGGTAGRVYLAVATIITVGGRTKRGEVLIQIRGRAVA